MAEDVHRLLERIGAAARIASRVLARTDKSQRASALQSIAASIRTHAGSILEANQRDVALAIKGGAKGGSKGRKKK